MGKKFSLREYNDLFVNQAMMPAMADAENNVNVSGSPLGSWVNLTLLAYSLQHMFSDEELKTIEKSLGQHVDDAFRSLEELTVAKPQLVMFAIAFWSKKDLNSYNLYDLIYDNVLVLNGLAKKSLPTQEEANFWVSENTFNIIKEFPVDFSDESLDAVLANVIATKISWDVPYGEIAGGDVAEHWNQPSVLHFDKDIKSSIVEADGKFYGLHKKSSTVTKGEGNKRCMVTIFSLIGNEENSLEQLYSVLANNIIYGEHSKDYFIVQNNDVLRFEHFDFATVSFEEVLASHHEPIVNVSLPAWAANFDYSINAAGFAPIINVMKKYDKDLENKQLVVAEYNKNGFEAAALTFTRMMGSSMPQVSSQEQATIELKFNNPFVSIAVFNAWNDETNVWDNQILFITFVREAIPVSEKTFI